MNQRVLFWNLLLVASCVAAAVSLLTTGLSLARYLAWPLAWPLALAVQMGLFGLAWLIAVRQVKLRALVITLYCLTMPFSVVFSYVMLQSEFTAEIRPQEAQRELFDDLRHRSAEVTGEIDKSLAESDELELRLASWLEIEQSQGWTTSTCDASTHCYLSGICERVQRRIDSWEARFGQYPQGPGEALIYRSLATEQAALRQIGESLRVAKQGWGRTAQVSDWSGSPSWRLGSYSYCSPARESSSCWRGCQSSLRSSHWPACGCGGCVSSSDVSKPRPDASSRRTRAEHPERRPVASSSRPSHSWAGRYRIRALSAV